MEAYKEAFADFDWNKSGTIPTSVRSRPNDLHKNHKFLRFQAPKKQSFLEI